MTALDLDRLLALAEKARTNPSDVNLINWRYAASENGRPLVLRLQAAEAALLEITKCRDEFASAHVRGIARHGLGLPARREPRAAKEPS